MSETGLTMERIITTFGRRMASAMTMPIAAMTMLGGCISVSAPDKPIVINLNINVTQEVVYRLDGQAKSLIQQNPGIF